MFNKTKIMFSILRYIYECLTFKLRYVNYIGSCDAHTGLEEK